MKTEYTTLPVTRNNETRRCTIRNGGKTVGLYESVQSARDDYCGIGTDDYSPDYEAYSGCWIDPKDPALRQNPWLLNLEVIEVITGSQGEDWAICAIIPTQPYI